MSIRILDQDELWGIFELDDDNRVVYSSLGASSTWLDAEQKIKGRAFFSEVLGFTNVAALQRRLEAFKAEAIPVRSFDFVCCFPRQSVRVKVLIARLSGKDGHPSSTLIQLRRSSEVAPARTSSPRF